MNLWKKICECDRRTRENGPAMFGMWIALGVAMGAAMDNIAVGIAVGTAIGAAFYAEAERKKK